MPGGVRYDSIRLRHFITLNLRGDQPVGGGWGPPQQWRGLAGVTSSGSRKRRCCIHGYNRSKLVLRQIFTQKTVELRASANATLREKRTEKLLKLSNDNDNTYMTPLGRFDLHHTLLSVEGVDGDAFSGIPAFTEIQ